MLVFSLVIIMVTSVRNDGSTVLPKKGQSFVDNYGFVPNYLLITHANWKT